MYTALMLGLAVALADPASGAQERAEKAEAPAKSAPPGRLEEEAGIKAVREAWAADFGNAKSPTEKSALSVKLLALALETKDPLGSWGAFRESIRLANEAANPACTFAAIEAQAKLFSIEVPKDKLRALRETVDGPPAAPVTALPTVAKAALVASSEAELADDYDTAAAMVDLAHVAAVKGKDLPTREAAEKAKATIKTVAKDFELASKAIASNPNAPAANLAWGRFLALGRGDWEKGLPYLAKASGDFAAAATADLAAPSDGTAREGLADQWWDLAAKEKEARYIAALRSRAAYWYGKASPGLTGPSKTKADERIAEATPTAASVAK